MSDGNSHGNFVQTVLGRVAAEEVGLTLHHEHLLFDLTGGAPSVDALFELKDSARRGFGIPESGWEPGEDGPGTAASWRAKWGQPLTLQNRADVARNFGWYGAKITDIESVIEEALLFKRSGGSCLVDQTSIGLSRDPVGLQQISRMSGVHVVMATSYYVAGFHPPELSDLHVDEVRDRIIRDIKEGVAGGVKAGIIGEVGLSSPLHPNEEKVLRASARAQLETGAPMSIHPGANGRESIQQLMEVLKQERADLERTVICHVDSRLASAPPNSFDVTPVLELARSGVRLGIDTFGWEESYRQRSAVDLPNDAVRLNWIMSLAEAGFAEQVLISSDLALPVWQRKNGGHGWQHIPETVTALMRYKGFDSALIDLLLVENPRRLLAMGAN